jgi:tyrosyl-DNA phosphodiesterase-1
MTIATLRRTFPFASSSKFDSKAKPTRPTGSDKGKSKVIVISDSETESESDEPNNAPEAQKEAIGWAYVGSHNFTPSAWGTLSGSGFNPTLNVGFALDSDTSPLTNVVSVSATDTIGC